MTPPRFIAHDIPDLLNALPTMFGFTPQESIVAIGTFGDRHRLGFSMRLDIPPPAVNPVVARTVAGHLGRQGAEGAIVLAVSERPEVAGPLVRAVERGLGSVRPVVGAWATRDRYWTTFEDDDPGGHPYELSGHHLAIVKAVAEGQEILPDRAALEERLSSVGGPRRRWLDRAADVVMTQVAAEVARHPDEDLVELAVRDVGGVVDRLLLGQDVTDAEVLRIGVWASTTVVRDHWWGQVRRDNAKGQHQLWTHVARHAPASLAPASWCLSAFAAWLAGDGASALIAAERAEAIDPEYSMAGLVLQILENGLSPETWSWRSQATARTR
jgi:hypothetical protein